MKNPYKSDVGGCQPGWHADIYEAGYKQGRRELIEWLVGVAVNRWLHGSKDIAFKGKDWETLLKELNP